MVTSVFDGTSTDGFFLVHAAWSNECSGKSDHLGLYLHCLTQAAEAKQTKEAADERRREEDQKAVFLVVLFVWQILISAFQA